MLRSFAEFFVQEVHPNLREIINSVSAENVARAVRAHASGHINFDFVTSISDDGLAVVNAMTAFLPSAAIWHPRTSAKLHGKKVLLLDYFLPTQDELARRIAQIEQRRGLCTDAVVLYHQCQAADNKLKVHKLITDEMIETARKGFSLKGYGASPWE